MHALFTGILSLAGAFFTFVSPSPAYISPLSNFSSEWNDEQYAICNTAEHANYMTAAEKEVIHILNLARKNPALFANTVVSKYPAYSGDLRLADSKYFTSLLATLKKMDPAPLIQPQQQSFESAYCHAESSGKAGYVGHTRQTEACKKNTSFFGECCDYGHNEPLDIVLSLLIDKDVPSLGHRNICLANYTGMGVSIQPHTKYRYNAVLDFTWL